MPSWEEMCQQIVVDGRPGDVTSAALGWEQLLKNLRTVKENLEKNVKDLGETWKGPAYESFRTHVEGLAKRTGGVVEDAEKHDGIVQSLKQAANDLTVAQQNFPIPASCVNDVLEARNAKLTISAGFFEMKVKPDFLGWVDPISSLMDWVNDKTEDAAKVYDQVSSNYLGIEERAPGTVTDNGAQNPNLGRPDLNTGGGGGGAGSVPSLGGSPSTGGVGGGSPSLGGVGSPPGTGSGVPGIGSGTHPGLDPGTGGYGGGSGGVGGLPGTGSLGDEYGSGLAGAGGGLGTLPGAGGGGLPSTTGLGGGAGLGGGGLGGGSGMIPGGGALGKPVTAGMPPMMGGAAGAGGAGRGGGGRGAGRLGGMGAAMAPGMGGAAGRGGAGKGAGGVRGATAGAGRGGVAGMGGGHGAGYGEEEAARNSWLEEDDDVWGADGDATPGILR
ncbi:WXG100 family type VII secretion target [Micromonospora citrea]|uniref:WXG100 family type VII secretion target n=1 Tax=Micromonospora citrea TaxID=47855 RepID=UPI003C6725D7